MAVGRITKRSVEALTIPPEGKRSYLWDESLKGFGAVVTPKGVRSYLVQYRMGGREAQTKRYTIGRHGSPWTADEARDRARELLLQIHRNIDPLEAERAARAKTEEELAEAQRYREICARLAFSTFADRFIEEYAKVEQPRTWKATKAVVDNDLKPAFGDEPLIEITDADIVELLRELKQRAPSASRRAYSALSVIYKHACDVERRYIKKKDNPMLEVDPPWKAEDRDRVLTNEELVLVWRAAGTLGWPYTPAVRLLALTGQRVNEVGRAPWPEFNLAKKEWVIPASRTKNKLIHLVPLAKPVVEIISDLPKVESDGDWLFSTTGYSPISGWMVAKRRLNEAILEIMHSDAREAGMAEDQVAKIEMIPWRLHDLRRTFATGCQSIGIPIEHSEAVLNHITYSHGGLKGVYHLYRYEKEKRRALNKWATHLLKLVGDDEIRRKKKAA